MVIREPETLRNGSLSLGIEDEVGLATGEVQLEGVDGEEAVPLELELTEDEVGLDVVATEVVVVTAVVVVAALPGWHWE